MMAINILIFTYSKSSYVYTDTKGGGWPHNHGETNYSSNLPPYITVYYWKRTE